MTRLFFDDRIKKVTFNKLSDGYEILIYLKEDFSFGRRFVNRYPHVLYITEVPNNGLSIIFSYSETKFIENTLEIFRKSIM